MKTKNWLIIAILTIALTSLTTAVTITGVGSSYTFTIANCSYTTNYEPLNCSASTIRYECDINPAIFVNQINFRIDGTDYVSTQNSTNPEQFYLNYQKTTEYTSDNTPITFDRQTITDVDSHSVNAYEVLTTNHTCLTCANTWTTNIIQACNTSNQQITQYTSSNLSCQPSYNLTETCDYCSPNVIANTTNCLINNTAITTYHDLALNSCCLTTGLISDCPTLTYPYNQPTSSNCQYYQNDMPCNIDTKPILAKKINLNCELPINEQANCVVNTYQNQNNTRILLATTPDYKQTSNSILTFFSEQETRTSFTTTNRLLNAYYTDKELRPNNAYEIEVVCSTNTTTYKTLQSITPEYHTPDELVYRIQWVGNNPVKFIIILLVTIAIFILIVYAIGKLRRGKI